jgi:hypothetical protein
MAFVKDNDKETRGVGAIASMDATSPARRIAAARSAYELARRDRVMSMHTLGAIKQTTGTVTGRVPAKRPAVVGPFATTAEIPRKSKPPLHVPPPLPRRAFSTTTTTDPRLSKQFSTLPKLPIATDAVFVKSPGSVIAPPTGVAPVLTALPPPPKPVVAIVGGGASTWSLASKLPAPADLPPMEPLPDLPDEAEVQLTPASAPKTKGNLLMYAAIGAGVLWLLTRKD